MMLFEWDETNRSANIAKHGLDLARAVDLFDGPPVVSYPSSRFGEAPTVTVGMLEREIVATVWTQRDPAIRLISLRRARDAEKGNYRTRFG
jgi:uncharacterized DUF497 family protein